MTEPSWQDHVHAARERLRAADIDAAYTQAWLAYDAAPNELPIQTLLAGLFTQFPAAISPDRLSSLDHLLHQKSVDPAAIASVGWPLLLTLPPLSDGATADPAAIADWLEADGFVGDLLGDAVIAHLDVEAALTAMRRWLLLSDKWSAYPRVTAALAAQTARNRGAWLYEEDERRHLAANPDFAPAYWPPEAWGERQPDYEDRTTRKVAAQYEGWPYPTWTRITAPTPTTWREAIRKFDRDGADKVPENPHILIAGCGTGREAMLCASRYRGARITAIDISETSLAYARTRFAEAGVPLVDFRLLDLHRVAELGDRFDAIFCSGVLHHLPSPEQGWAELASVLKPGGVMKIMVYSKLARLRVRAFKQSLTDLLDKPVDDDLLRAARRRLIAIRQMHALPSLDFFSLPGVHDLLLHRHEDPFDIPRIRRTIDTLGLQFIGFSLPDLKWRRQYLDANPDDPQCRDMNAWQRFELANPTVFARMYDFMCRKPA